MTIGASGARRQPVHPSASRGQPAIRRRVGNWRICSARRQPVHRLVVGIWRGVGRAGRAGAVVGGSLGCNTNSAAMRHAAAAQRLMAVSTLSWAAGDTSRRDVEYGPAIARLRRPMSPSVL